MRSFWEQCTGVSDINDGLLQEESVRFDFNTRYSMEAGDSCHDAYVR